MYMYNIGLHRGQLRASECEWFMFRGECEASARLVRGLFEACSSKTKVIGDRYCIHISGEKDKSSSKHFYHLKVTRTKVKLFLPHLCGHITLSTGQDCC